jgi:hypothetical protein
MKTKLYPSTLGSIAPMQLSSHSQIIAGVRSNIRKWILTTGLFGILILSGFAGKSQANTSNCCGSSFGAVTLYYSVLPGSNFGFGMEGGNWNKESSPFSFFLGAKMQWYHQPSTGGKTINNNEYINYGLYVKGQFKIVDELYITAAPQFVNMSSFDFSPGLRYVLPVANGFGVGLEPSYSIVQKQFTLSANIHIAL